LEVEERNRAVLELHFHPNLGLVFSWRLFITPKILCGNSGPAAFVLGNIWGVE
jgi:hypothetical protein